MGIFEGITHSEEIQELLNDAQVQYDSAKKRLEHQKTRTTNSLERLGKDKLHAWSGEMNKFLDSFGSFNNIQMVCKIDENYDFLGKSETPNELMVNMQNATYNANEIIKAGAVAIGTGALVGIATYGGVAMFANASTGTAIAALNGAAKKNATLAWLGGGSLASGGSGIAGGKVVLGGVVLGTIAVVGGLIAATQSQAKLAEARRVHAETESAISKMNVVITGMEGIEKYSEIYREFISDLSGLFTPYLIEMDSIAGKYEKGSDGKVDFNALSEMEQKTLHLSWLIAQLYYHILSVPILNEQGEVDPSSRKLLQNAKQDYVQLSGQAKKLENEKKTIEELLTNARNEFKTATEKYYTKKRETTEALVKIGKRRIELWEISLASFMNALSHFENISVDDIYPYNVTEIPIEFIFESSEAVLKYISQLKLEGIDTIGKTGLVEIALFGGEDFLGELSQVGNEKDAINKVHRHDMSLWFTGELDSTIAKYIPFGEVSDDYIIVIGQKVKGISGRENLAQAQEINKEVIKLSIYIKKAISDFDAITKKIKKIEKALKRYNKVQEGFIEEISRIEERHHITDETIQFDLLLESEKRVFAMSFIIAKIQYTILASCILQEFNGGDVDDSYIVIENAKKVYNTLKKDSFTMNNDNDLQIVNIIWKKDAEKAIIAGFIMVAICLIIMVAQLAAGNLFGLIDVIGAVFAFPLFFYFKNLNQGKLFLWRCIRIVAAIVVVLITVII